MLRSCNAGDHGTCGRYTTGERKACYSSRDLRSTHMPWEVPELAFLFLFPHERALQTLQATLMHRGCHARQLKDGEGCTSLNQQAPLRDLDSPKAQENRSCSVFQVDKRCSAKNDSASSVGQNTVASMRCLHRPCPRSHLHKRSSSAEVCILLLPPGGKSSTLTPPHVAQQHEARLGWRPATAPRQTLALEHCPPQAAKDAIRTTDAPCM